jgi:hypothetical protein
MVHPYNGDYVVLPCEGTAPISVVLTQDGVHPTGKFQSGCAGIMEIHGLVSGDRISGSLDSPSTRRFPATRRPCLS